MSVRKHLIHVKSNQLMTGSTTEPKAPNASDISYGEIAINYRKDKERIFIKNSDDEIVCFVSSKVIEDNEQVIAQALATEREERINNTYTKSEVDSLLSEIDRYSNIIETEENGFYIVDPNLNVGMYITAEGTNFKEEKIIGETL